MNRSCFSILGIIFALLLVIGGIFAGAAFYLGPKYDGSSHQYVDEALPAILNGWHKDELVKRASPEFNQAADDEKITHLFTELESRLGAFKKYDGAHGEANIAYYSATGVTITAKYEAEAEFEKGKADINISLIQHGGQWQVVGFYVNPQP